MSDWPGAILAIPLVGLVVRRLLGRVFPENRVWGVERPGLETWTAILAFAPVVGWLGNPAWWRDTLPRLTHYYTLSTDASGTLPDIQIIYFGQVYEFSLPWHNGWVLMGDHRTRRNSRRRGDGADLGDSEDRARPAAVLLSRSFSDSARDPDVPDAGARRRAAVPAHFLLPGGLCGLGSGLAG